LREKGLREEEFRGQHTVARHQQTAGETRFDCMKAVARHGLPRQGQLGIDVAIQFPSERQALPQCFAKADRCHAHGRPACLHEGANR